MAFRVLVCFVMAALFQPQHAVLVSPACCINININQHTIDGYARTGHAMLWHSAASCPTFGLGSCRLEQLLLKAAPPRSCTVWVSLPACRSGPPAASQEVGE